MRAVIVAVVLLGAACSADDTTTSGGTASKAPVETGDTSGPGSPDVYERINSLTSCEALQAEFDLAADNNDRAEPGSELFDVTLSYMRAADERLDELGCY